MSLLLIIGLALVPWIELRGAVPVGIGLGYDPLLVFALAVVANCVVIVPGFIALDLFYARVFSRFPWFRRNVERVRGRGKGLVERYELLGLAIFVAVPLPGTGAYAGTLLAWVLGLHRWKATLAVAGGVVAAGVIVTLISTGALAVFRDLAR